MTSVGRPLWAGAASASPSARVAGLPLIQSSRYSRSRAPHPTASSSWRRSPRVLLGRPGSHQLGAAALRINWVGGEVGRARSEAGVAPGGSWMRKRASKSPHGPSRWLTSNSAWSNASASLGFRAHYVTGWLTQSFLAPRRRPHRCLLIGSEMASSRQLRGSCRRSSTRLASRWRSSRSLGPRWSRWALSMTV